MPIKKDKVVPSPSPNTIQLKLVAKRGLKNVMELEGRRLPLELTTYDAATIHATEVFLERLFGYRFHIITMREWWGEKEGETNANKS